MAGSRVPDCGGVGVFGWVVSKFQSLFSRRINSWVVFLLSQKMTLAKLKKLEITSSKRYGAGFIMGRNLLLYSIALVEFKYEYGIIASGIHKGTNYADCKPKFLTKVQETYDIYTEGRVRLLTPFINWVKADILQYCEEKEVPINITYSCEIGKEKPCGKCLSCLDLKKYYAGKNN